MVKFSPSPITVRSRQRELPDRSFLSPPARNRSPPARSTRWAARAENGVTKTPKRDKSRQIVPKLLAAGPVPPRPRLASRSASAHDVFLFSCRPGPGQRLAARKILSWVHLGVQKCIRVCCLRRVHTPNLVVGARLAALLRLGVWALIPCSRLNPARHNLCRVLCSSDLT